MTRGIKRVAIGVLLAAAGYTAWLRFPLSAIEIPVAPVRQGDLEIILQFRGELRALRTVTLAAPTSVNEVRLVSLEHTGTIVEGGDVVAELDSTSEERKLRESQASVRNSDKEIVKTKAQQKVKDEEEDLELAHAQFEVERAGLESRKRDIVSEIDSGKAALSLDNAERKLKELGARTAVRNRAQVAEIEQAEQKKRKAAGEVAKSERNLKGLNLQAPIAGMLNILPNIRNQASGQSPLFKAGDPAFPGAAIAEIPDLTSLIAELQVSETDRGRVAPGQDVRVRVDAVSDRPLTGKVQSIDTIARYNFETSPPEKSFRAQVLLDALMDRLRPGMSAAGSVVVERLKNVILIPDRAVFDRGDRMVVFVRKGSAFEERVIVVGRKSLGQVEVVRGLASGESVALVDLMKKPDEDLPGAGS